MRNEEGRDETAHELADMLLVPRVQRDNVLVMGGRFIDMVEDAWQELHATEEPYERLHVDYYEGLSELVLRTANVLLDEIRERIAQQPGGYEIAQRVQALKIKIGGENDG